MDFIIGTWNYWGAGLILFTGLYIVVASNHLVRKLIGLAIFQNAVIVFFISMSYIHGGSEPIFKQGIALYTNPLPHVLMLTAIVVGLGTTALGFTLIIKLQKSYKTLNELKIKKIIKSKKSV